jgi:ribose transport system permease protein
MISMPIIYAVILGIIGQIILSRTRFGREVLAIGGNRETAHLAGIKVNSRKMITFMATSALSAFAGVLMASRFAVAQPAAGTGTELSIMAGVIIGGTSMFGGQGTVVGSALGAILLATITNALILMNVSTLWTSFIYGLILVVALYVDKYRRRVLSGEK